jgi:cell division transport system ATP-binding protein
MHLSTENSTGLNHQTPLFKLEDVSIKLSDQFELSKVLLQVLANDLLFITGPSGAGKTTLIRILAGELSPKTGRISLPRQKYIAVVDQEFAYLQKKTCLQNLRTCYDPSVHGSKKEFLNEVEELAGILKIKDRLEVKMERANGGLKQLIAIMKAVLSKPDVILADEPTSSLDMENAKRVFEIFEFLNKKRGTTIVWASHNRDLVNKFANKIIHIDNGRIVHSGHACFI